jgi:cytidylate kinase
MLEYYAERNRYSEEGFVMALVTISRGSASGGRLLAEGMAAKLGFTLVSREDIVHAAGRFGVPEEELHEALLKPPGFWERLHYKRRRYLVFIKLALCEKAVAGNIIYHGNAGHLLLPADCRILRLRLVAPLEYRVRVLQERDGMSRENAIAYIQKTDEQRRKWTQFLYGVDILDPHLYDLVLNLQTLDIESAVEVAATAASRPEFSLNERDRQNLADFLLASRVEAALAVDRETATLEVKASARGGIVSLSGRLASESEVGSVLRIAGAVPGVEKIERSDLDSRQPLV